MAHIIGNVSLSRNVYSLPDIAKFERISNEKIRKLMDETLKKTVLSSENQSATGLKAFFNEIGRYDPNVNLFLTHRSLSPFAKGIKLEFERCYKGNKEIQYAMFYIGKSIYDRWRKRRIPYNSDAKPNVSEYGLPKLENSRSVKIRKCPEFLYFEDIVKQLGFTVPEAIQLAINEYMQRHSDVFINVPHSAMIDEREVRENKMSLIFAYIDPNVTSAVYKTLQRYNSVNCPYIKFSDFVETALVEKLDRLSVKYTDPELYKEMLELEKAENEFLSETGKTASKRK